MLRGYPSQSDNAVNAGDGHEHAAGTIMSRCSLICFYSKGGRGMRITTIAFAFGTALVLYSLGTFSAAVQARTVRVVREPRERLFVAVPVTRPYWDYYIVPRYRYRPEDDRIDPYGPPVVPVIRYGSQEVTLPPWAW